MSQTHHAEHAWAAEHLEWYLAGGTGPDRGRFEAHLAGCADCRGAADEARAQDARIRDLFASARPAPGLEDRMIRAISAASIGLADEPPAPVPFPAWFRNAALAAAACLALVALGTLGAFVNDRLEKGSLPFFGSEKARDGRAGAQRKISEQEIAEAASAVDLNSSSDRFVTQPQAAMETALRDAKSRERGDGDIATIAPTNATRQEKLADLEQRILSRNADAGVVTFDELAAQTQSRLSSNENGRYQAHWATHGDAGVKNLRLQNRAQDDQIRKLEESVAGDREREDMAVSAGRLKYKVDAPTDTFKNELGKKTKENFYYAELDYAAPTAKSPPVKVPGQGSGVYVMTDGDNGKPAPFRPGELASADPSAPPAPKPDGKPDPKDAPANDPAKAPDANAPKGNQPPPNPGPAGAEAPKPAPEPVMKRKIIRNGEMEFEVESYTAASRTVAKVVAEEDGQIATENSDRLANGKIRGVIVIRCPPDNLERLTEKLRALGDLKSKRLTSEDVTKQYTDLESRLRAARTMEERLIRIIKEGKGEIKDLLAAEKELGVWRTKIEEFQGEMNYLNNLVSSSTLTLTLFEKDIRAAAVATETERVRLGLETEDVEKAYKDALGAIADAKGRVTKSELKKHEAGQFAAVINCEVNPDAAGALRDRLSQLGKVARLEVDRDQTAGDGKASPDLKVKRSETVFFISLYNLANVAPRETVMLTLAAADAEAVYARVLARVEKAAGRVVNSQMARQKNDQSSGTINFEVKASEADAVLADLRAAGEVVRLQVAENADTQNVTKSKRGFAVQIFAMGLVAPRETSSVQLAGRDVAAAYKAMQEAVAAAKGRVLAANLNEQDRNNISGTLDFEIGRADEAAITAALAKAGEVLTRNVQRASDGENVIDSKVRISLTLVSAATIPARETILLTVVATDVHQSVAKLAALTAKLHGTVQNSEVTREADGRVRADLVYRVPLAEAGALADAVRAEGIVRENRMTRNPAAPDGPAAVAMVGVRLKNEDLIIPSDDGVWPQVRKGLAASFTALSVSLTFVVIGVCFVLPVALILYFIYRVWFRRPAAAAPAPAPTAPPGS